MTLEDFILSVEGLKLQVYKDSAGLDTIGIGHCLSQEEIMCGKIKIGEEYIDYENGLAEDQIKALLKADLHPRLICVEEWVTVPLTENQKTALVSFAFNVGVGNFKESTLLDELNKSNYRRVPGEFLRWVKITKDGKKEVCQGLVNRRWREIAMWEGKIV
jgi:lysozyme